MSSTPITGSDFSFSTTEIPPSKAGIQSKYVPKNEPFNPHKPVKAIIVGAGIAGIATAILLSKKVPNLQYTVYEKNKTVGGTWAENVYPGVRCDVPSHVYQLTFAPNLKWSEYYPKGAEIRGYYENVVEDYKVTDNLRLEREVVSATWLEEVQQWEVVVKDPTGKGQKDWGDFLISAPGRLNKPTFPDIPGLWSRFQGNVLHTGNYDTNFDPTEKKVAIIGNGASGQQLLPNIVSKTAHIDHYIRSKTWVTPTFRGDMIQATAEKPGGPAYTEAQKREWEDNPASYLAFRKNLEAKLHGRFQSSILGSAENEAFRQRCIETMLSRVNGDREWLNRIVPDYAPGCKRPTPAPGYIEALISPKVEYITEAIAEVVESGILTVDGKFREVDTIIAATGYSGGFSPRFTTIGRGGSDLSKTWSANGPTGYPETYFGIMAPGFPNYFFVLQAQGNGAGGSVPIQCEVSATFIAKAIRKIQSQSYASLEPSLDTTIEFNRVVDGHFEDKVMQDECNSWLKAGKGRKRVLTGWPGSGHHRFDVMRDPRWEDFNFKRRADAASNRYEYFGNGWTEREKGGGLDEITRYIQEVGNIDLEMLHEAWNL